MDTLYEIPTYKHFLTCTYVGMFMTEPPGRKVPLTAAQTDSYNLLYLEAFNNHGVLHVVGW